MLCPDPHAAGHVALCLQQQEQQQQASGPMVLYFGCRRSDQDYLYGPLLEQWAADGSITLYNAFSRQQVSFWTGPAVGVSP